MAQTHSIEVVTEYGRKARIIVSGHWSLVNQVVTSAIVTKLTQDEGAPFALSDLEEWDEEVDAAQAVADARVLEAAITTGLLSEADAVRLQLEA